tara:strand:+ start:156 stop:449 length:294 start_codon:yes stop_codon:yes gene_type:complete
MRFVKFVDTATSDENACPIANIESVNVIDNASVTILWKNNNSGQSGHLVDITCEGTTNAAAVANFVIAKLASSRAAMTEINADSHPKIVSMAYAAGS